MPNYSNEHRILLYQLYIENNRSVTVTIRKFATKNKLKLKSDYPSESTVRNLVKKFEETASLTDKPRSGRPSVSVDTCDLVRERMTEEGSSINSVHLATGVPRSTVHKIVKTKLKMIPYKVQVGQALTLPQKDARVKFCRQILDKDLESNTFLSNILFSDEANFYLNGWVNRQNIRFWGEEWPETYPIIEASKFSKKLVVFCALSARFVIGPYFFEENIQPVTVNGERYLQMLQSFLVPELKKRHKLSQTTYQQDGATWHITQPVKTFLETNLKNRILSRQFPFEWPANSPDLSPLDFWFWGYVKTEVYKHGRPESLEILKERIHNVVQSINVDHLKAAVQDVLVRAEICEEVSGSHFEHLL